jgi:hypothetical protein
MVLLEGSIHKLKVDFNNKILDLKHKKIEIIDTVKTMNNRIEQINKVLEVEEKQFVPEIDEKAEYPQKFFDVSEKDIDEYRQLKIQREQEAANAKKGTKKKRGQAAADEEAEKQAAAEQAKKAA